MLMMMYSMDVRHVFAYMRIKMCFDAVCCVFVRLMLLWLCSTNLGTCAIVAIETVSTPMHH